MCSKERANLGLGETRICASDSQLWEGCGLWTWVGVSGVTMTRNATGMESLGARTAAHEHVTIPHSEGWFCSKTNSTLVENHKIINERPLGAWGSQIESTAYKIDKTQDHTVTAQATIFSYPVIKPSWKGI